MKHRHNKKRNTAFLYEVLIMEYAKAAVEKNAQLRQTILGIIKEHFTKDSMLLQELKLYKGLVETNGLNELLAEKVILETKRQHECIDEEDLLEEQTNLYRQIKKHLGKDAMNNFVPNYKSLATISQIFNRNVPIKAKVLLENEMIKKMTIKETKKDMVPIDNLVFKTLVKNYNEEYADQLLEEQKVLLNKFIMSFSDNEADLKIYLNEEIGRLKKELNASLGIEEFAQDPHMLKAAKDVVSLLEGYKDIQIGPEIITEVLKIQKLVGEIKG